MQKFMRRSAIAGLTAAVTMTGAAWAGQPGEFLGAARLSAPLSAPVAAKLAGVQWRCADTGCLGVAQRYNTLDSLVRQCRQVATRFGPVQAYASRGQRLSRAGLIHCNRAAAADIRDLRLAAGN